MKDDLFDDAGDGADDDSPRAEPRRSAPSSEPSKRARGRMPLWLKLIGDPTIEGFRMPVNPISGGGALDMDKLDDIRMWIENGAPND